MNPSATASLGFSHASTGCRPMTQEEFDAFYTGSFARLVGQIYAICGNAAEAQDCVQEAFVRAWDKRRSLNADHAPEAWVRTVAYRLAVSRWRKTRRRRARPTGHTGRPPHLNRTSPASPWPEPCSSCRPRSAGPSFCTTCAIFR